MVQAIQALGLRYIAMNPGSSFRGLHDSLVNFGGGSPAMLTCPHETVAVELAHGYAKACGEPMAVILHDVVGLLHGAMGIYYAHVDRAPVVVLGGAGPMALERRRPNIDWIHTANVQGNAVRDFTKWDDQPASIQAVPEVLARAYRVAMSEPRGPVYVALDAGLQEEPLEAEVQLPAFDRLGVPSRLAPEPAGLERLARGLVEAQRPVLVTGYAGRDPAAFDQLVALAELLGAGVVDTNLRLSFPNRHPLNVTGAGGPLEEADVVCFVDVKDMGKPTQTLDSAARRVRSRLAPGTTILDLGFNDLGISAWSHDFAALHETDIQVTADTSVALPLLLEACRRLEATQPERRDSRELRSAELTAAHDATWARWRSEAEADWDGTPVSTARLAGEVWEAVREHDWVLSAGTAAGWALRTWDFDRAYRHPGASLGTATQIGISLGVALAHRDAGRLVVDLQPDGDLMFHLSALWVAAHHSIPMLVVTFNNRAYYNDWEHQERMARERGTPLENASAGMELDRPAPDFAGVARSLGWWAEGPVEEPSQLAVALRRGVEEVVSNRRPALVDVVCRNR
jgi:benzoylformate decarboxylase/acetolactate synthase-1/2/3 large subunit